MKRCRLFAFALILVLISSPAMAAMCAAKCAGSELIGAMHAKNQTMASDTVSSHCQQQAEKSNKPQPQAEHKSCSMVGCHFSTSAPFISSAQFAVADFSNSVSTYFSPVAISAELPPPIKPPA